MTDEELEEQEKFNSLFKTNEKIVSLIFFSLALWKIVDIVNWLIEYIKK